MNYADGVRRSQARGHASGQGTGHGPGRGGVRGATLTVEDDRRDYGEDRFIIIGFLDCAMVVLVWMLREGA